jgi:hypothetical protein
MVVSVRPFWLIFGSDFNHSGRLAERVGARPAHTE